MDANDPRPAFLAEAWRLTEVDRASVLMDLSRAENSAEHSWHVALYAMVFGASDRAIAMLLLHDLVEIDVGDHPIHLPVDAAAVALAEDLAAQRLFSMLPDGDHFLSLWREFEAGASEDARMAKRMDHIQPLFQVLCAPDPLPDHLDIVEDNLSTGRAARLRDEWPEVFQLARSLQQGVRESSDLVRCIRFLAGADRVKSVGGAGTANAADQSWIRAVNALISADCAKAQVNIGRVVQMLLIAELGKDVQSDPFALLPEAQATAFKMLAQEYRQAQTPDAAFARELACEVVSA